ncbi:MAG TPA: response regulator [Anaerolineales bacterium]|nr:response regulator [Anaerolineales bacterium]HRQ92733.1 response regulator [Anaerolineales bacterium]
MMENGELIDILLVEDNPGDVRLTQEAFKDGMLRNNLHVAMDGEQALDFLYRRGQFLDAPRPDLILLDLNLPKMNGREVLAAIKQDVDLKQIPVVVLTTSQDEADITESYRQFASSYIVKPVSMDKFLKVVSSFKQYWLSVVKLPAPDQ